MTIRITIAKGDGIGPEIMDATLSVLSAAGAELEFDEIQVGESVYLSGNTAGISKELWDVIQKPQHLAAVSYPSNAVLKLPKYKRKPVKKKQLVGVDLFVHWPGTDAAELAQMLQSVVSSEVALEMITNRGIKVYPDGFSETFCTDHWRCRFKPTGSEFTKNHIVHLYQNAMISAVDVIKLEQLYTFDGTLGYSLGQGQ